MKRGFQSVFTKENNFKGMSKTTTSAMLEEINVEIREVLKIMESLNVRISPGLDEISAG